MTKKDRYELYTRISKYFEDIIRTKKIEVLWHS